MAKEQDIPRISDLLAQVCPVHHNGRPDIFKVGRKYSEKDLNEAAVKLAWDCGCCNLTLNVWNCNPSAMRFYEAQRLVPQRIGMELIL